MNRTVFLTGCLVLTLGAPVFAQTAPCRGPATRDASWSPDGTKLVFDSGRDGNQEIYTINVDGTEITRLTHTEAADYYPFFSPDGSRIVFFGSDVIYVMNADGSDLTPLTDESSSNADPDWSPDGSRIAFYSERDGNAEIYVMDSDGGNQTRLTFSDASETTPAWSPDGTRIVFISTRDGNAEVYVMAADGSNQTRITHDPRSDRVARWSPDGERIIFYSRPGLLPSATREERNASWARAEIYVINADGTGRRQITYNNHRDSAPVFSPDGKHIAYTSCASGNMQIHVMDADGSNARQLTFNPSGDGR